MIEDVKCPECQGPMTSRKNGTTGQRFWGCNRYPNCRGTRNTDGEAPTRSNSQRRETDTDAMPSQRQRGNDRGRWRNQ